VLHILHPRLFCDEIKKRLFMKYFSGAPPKSLSTYNYFLIYFASLIILFTSLLTTFFLWQRVEFQISSDSEKNFHGKVNNIELALKDKSQFQIDALYQSISSSYNRGSFVNLLDWENLVTHLQDEHKFPGIQSIALIEKVSDSQKDQYVKKVRKDEQENSPLYKDFVISPTDSKLEYYVLKYVTPLTGNEELLGQDMAANPEVMSALDRARDTGAPARSDEHIPIGKSDTGFVIYMPLFAGKADRNPEVNRERLRGFARVVYSSRNFFINSLNNPNDRENIDIQIIDQSNGGNQQVFESLTLPNSVSSSSKDLLKLDGIVSVGQKLFNIHYAVRKDQSLGVTERNIEVYVVVLGSLLSFLISTIFYLLTTSRARALMLADHITSELNVEKSDLEQERTKLEIILQSIGDGVFVVNEKSQIILLNKVAQQYLDVSPAEALNKHYCDVFHFVWERNPAVHCPKFIEDVIRTGAKKKLEDRFVLIKKDVRIPVDASASPVKDEDGKVVGCVVVVRDVTRERKVEDDKDNFLSIAAHQLKTPLGSMRWNLEMLIGGDFGKVPPTLTSSLTQLLENNQRMIKLVSDFLDVSRINQHRIKDMPAPTNIGQTVKLVVEELKPMIKKKEIDVNLKLDELSDITIDPARWKEVVEHLVNNAIQYSFYQGKVAITLEKRADQIALIVADNGMGISKKDQLQIFSKFFRGENALHSEADGSGLGLFVVKSYVEAWGGEITFESKVGRGTTFTLTLPFEPKRYIVDGTVTEM
jgi:PAS domain S-box-containing protein